MTDDIKLAVTDEEKVTNQTSERQEETDSTNRIAVTTPFKFLATTL